MLHSADSPPRGWNKLKVPCFPSKEPMSRLYAQADAIGNKPYRRVSNQKRNKKGKIISLKRGIPNGFVRNKCAV
ncbi:unnamed protein product [Chondrus crispus]|uniref:Uncharacterized protein n=1 Tax=Chondrus crispus TaxID=2769 RepID=R7QRJ2_CHOCR|nr:unnamed protein product [Chondrus crispus]CDF40368.1 unnamed protein product [Chondrus crispus]|eukprot:XP_005710662.1 unnamed protein product [Chondrus crispus]